MKEFDKFCIKLGDDYKNNYHIICTDNEYNNGKALDLKINKQQFIQASSEQIYYYWLKNIFTSLSYDTEVNSPKDVDIYYDGEPFNLRIEVKTPIIEIIEDDYDTNLIKIKQEHRYDNIPKEQSPTYKAFHKYIENLVIDINNVSNKTGKHAKSFDIKDLKLDTFLKNANEKFLKPDNKSINILLLCLNTGSFSEYLDYIMNMDTGLFSNDPYINNTRYSNIDFIILSNCCDAHLRNDLNFNVWDATNYIHFVIPLHLTDVILKDKGNFLAKLFKDEFMYFYNNKDKIYNKLNTGDIQLQFAEFLSKRHPMFCKL